MASMRVVLTEYSKLKKSLYGLKQAARQWNIKLHSALTEMGFKRVEADRSVYIYSDGHVRIFVPIYIDDIPLLAKMELPLIERSNSLLPTSNAEI